MKACLGRGCTGKTERVVQPHGPLPVSLDVMTLSQVSIMLCPLRRLRVASQSCRPLSKFVHLEGTSWLPAGSYLLYFTKNSRKMTTRTAHDMSFDMVQALTKLQRRQVSVGRDCKLRFSNWSVHTISADNDHNRWEPNKLSTWTWRVGNRSTFTHSAGIKW